MARRSKRQDALNTIATQVSRWESTYVRQAPVNLRSAQIKHLFRSGAGLRDMLANIGALLLHRFPEGQQSTSDDIAWCQDQLEPLLGTASRMMDAFSAGLDHVQVAGLTAEQTDALRAVLRHDLPRGYHSWLQSASYAIQIENTLPVDLRSMLHVNVQSLNLGDTLKAAVLEAAPELARFGCPVAHTSVLRCDDLPVGGLGHVQFSAEDQETVITALKNFLTNGARRCRRALARDERTVVATVTQFPGGALQIEVEDNGIGVPSDRIGDLGKRGVMLREVHVPGESGTGLYGVIQNGWLPLFLRVKYDAEGQRVGSVFRYYVPSDAIVGSKPVGCTSWNDLLDANQAAGFVLLPQSALKTPTDPDTSL